MHLLTAQVSGPCEMSTERVNGNEISNSFYANNKSQIGLAKYYADGEGCLDAFGFSRDGDRQRRLSIK
jgi:hypothetical protein